MQKYFKTPILYFDYTQIFRDGKISLIILTKEKENKQGNPHRSAVSLHTLCYFHSWSWYCTTFVQRATLEDARWRVWTDCFTHPSHNSHEPIIIPIKCFPSGGILLYSSTQEAEAGLWAWGHPGIHSKTLNKQTNSTPSINKPCSSNELLTLLSLSFLPFLLPSSCLSLHSSLPLSHRHPHTQLQTINMFGVYSVALIILLLKHFEWYLPFPPSPSVVSRLSHGSFKPNAQREKAHRLSRENKH